MRVGCVGARPTTRGIGPQGLGIALAAGLLLVTPLATADPVTATVPDAPASGHASPTRTFVPTSDLDGLYAWLGPIGAASRIAGQWDSTWGADLSIVRVREGQALGVIGGDAGASRWTERGGGRIWLDGVVGTQVFGRMLGLTAGPILELADLARPRIGGSVGAWGFVGVGPFVRAGAVTGLGTFVEIGIHIALPVFRHTAAP